MAGRLALVVVASCLAIALGTALGGCESRKPGGTGATAAAPATFPDAEERRVALRQASQQHRRQVESLLGKGQALVDTCRPGIDESVRLTRSHSRHRSATFTLGITAEPKGGATAVWHVFPWDRDARKYTALKPQGVRLDGNGWRQARQLVMEPRFTLLPPVDAGGLDGEAWVVESCVRGRYQFVRRWSPRDPDDPFVRVARSLGALAGSVCEMPADVQVPDRHLFGVPPC